MKALAYPRRAMRPHPAADDMPPGCAWCGKPIRPGVVFTRGKDMGKDAIICPGCVAPPAVGERPTEIMVEDGTSD